MTQPPPVPLLFGFRGIRLLQVIVVLAAISLGLGAILILLAYRDTQDTPLLLLAALFGILFLWLFAIALRLPTSFVAISPERMRIRFGGFVDTTLETDDVAGAQLVNWKWWHGIGVRTGFGGDVALVAAGGPAAEVTLKRPIRVWIIPRIWRVSATRVVMSVRNPHKMVERFGPVPAQTSGRSGSKRKRR